ncbi:MAG: hypothetical protein SFW62_08715 [Alphaproteobacteria bacterium]|nr:hypothetical protein [Alphaproteobacteria bacterium]
MSKIYDELKKAERAREARAVGTSGADESALRSQAQYYLDAGILSGEPHLDAYMLRDEEFRQRICDGLSFEQRNAVYSAADPATDDYAVRAIREAIRAENFKDEAPTTERMGPAWNLNGWKAKDIRNAFAAAAAVVGGVTVYAAGPVDTALWLASHWRGALAVGTAAYVGYGIWAYASSSNEKAQQRTRNITRTALSAIGIAGWGLRTIGRTALGTGRILKTGVKAALFVGVACAGYAVISGNGNALDNTNRWGHSIIAGADALKDKAIKAADSYAASTGIAVTINDSHLYGREGGPPICLIPKGTSVYDARIDYSGSPEFTQVEIKGRSLPDSCNPTKEETILGILLKAHLEPVQSVASLVGSYVELPSTAKEPSTNPLTDLSRSLWDTISPEDPVLTRRTNAVTTEKTTLYIGGEPDCAIPEGISLHNTGNLDPKNPERVQVQINGGNSLSGCTKTPGKIVLGFVQKKSLKTEISFN